MELVKYNINEAEIGKMSDIYMSLIIKDFEDQDGYDAVHTARLVMVRHRTAIDKLRKSTNETAQKFIKNNNANAKKLTGLMEPIETHLKTEEDKITKEKERIKAEEERLEKAKIETRVSELFALGVNIPFFDLAMLSDNEYAEKFQNAKTAYDAEQIRIAEEEKRLEEEKLELARLREKEEADRKAESERLEKLAKEQAVEAERLAKIQDDIDAKEKILKDEQDKLEADKKVEQDRKDREAFEKQTQIETTRKARFESLELIGYTYPLDDLGIMSDKNYLTIFEAHKTEWDEKQKKIFLAEMEKDRIQAKKEADEKAALETKKLKEKEEVEATEKIRQEILLPDKTKLLNFADLIHVLASSNFSMRSAEAQALYSHTANAISDLETTLRKEIEEL